ncbi:Acetylcholine receptor subunit beta-like 2 [Amphibalanus amphitrite]|uniref:Acetylcholine receptor subunit beta-like 2 n=1 Tax=Amphibalanus amphitrite TaxID=1232801 RepID=A0A6A4XDK5_AMPAM|nr:Acetylcholine receptor subunit beta-like 2 [Amphibalanus amphitrite]
MVLDRLFLWLFTLACVLGTVAIIFQAPSLYDTRDAIDSQYSNIKVPTTRPQLRRLSGWAAERLTGWAAERLTGWAAGRLSGWTAGRLAEQC